MNKTRVDLLVAKKDFQFQIHNQGTDESCVSHAFTAAHEIFIAKHLNNDDLLEGTKWMTEIGALMMDMAKKIESVGQREKTNKGMHINFTVYYNKLTLI